MNISFFKKIGLTLFLGLMVVAPLITWALSVPKIADDIPKAPTETSLNVKFGNPFGDNITSIPQFISKIVDLLINFGGVIVVFFIILSGFKFVIAQGNPEKIKDAKNVLKWTIIGGSLFLLGVKSLFLRSSKSTS